MAMPSSIASWWDDLESCELFSDKEPTPPGQYFNWVIATKHEHAEQQLPQAIFAREHVAARTHEDTGADEQPFLARLPVSRP
jgi:hypothetical protein